MQIKTFRAESLQEALQLVRLELGPDASVLHTRQVKQSRLSVFGKKWIEVEASAEMPVASKFADLASRQSATTTIDPVRAHSVHVVERTRPSADSPASISEGDLPPADEPSNPPKSRFGDRLRSLSGRKDKNALKGQAAPTPDALEPRPTQETDATETPRPKVTDRMPAAAYEVVSELLDQGFPAKVAAELVKSSLQELPTDQQDDTWLLRGRIGQHFAKQFRTSGPIEATPGGDPAVVAFMGPTGVGKTTTLAKIAAGFRFDLGLDVGMITIDTFRLGAVDQLLQYAELISAPLEVVSAPDQITGAIQRQRECDIILIDTAGRSPRDSEQLAVLGQFLDAAQPDQRHLVLNTAMSHQAAKDAMRRFAVTQPSHLLLSKIDESVCLGTWYEMLAESPLPISYVTTGQHVPQDIAVASGRKLASIMLGSSQHQAQPA